MDDQPQVLPREQLHRLVRLPEFKAPFDEEPGALDNARRELERFMQKG